MPELFQEMYYGPNVQNLVESDDCKVMMLCSENSSRWNSPVISPSCITIILLHSS